MFQPEMIREIAADPDNPLPRLIYADWLEEQGDDARAAFIRIHCELDHDDGDPRLADLRTRANVLLHTYRESWVAELGAGVRVHRFRFGLIDDIVIEPRLLWDDDVPALDRAPITGLRVALNDAGLVERLARLPQLAQVRRLYLRGSELGSEGLQRLLNSPHFPELEVFSLESCMMSRMSMRRLAESKKLRRLQHLDLSHNPIGSAGIQELTRATFPALESLFVNHCNIDEEGARLLATTRKMPRLVAVRSRDSSTAIQTMLRERLSGRSQNQSIDPPGLFR